MAKPISEAPELPDMYSDGDQHTLYRNARAVSPVVRSPMGLAVALRARHMETILSDVTRQMETETLMMQGVMDGPIFDLRKNAVLFANGDAHIRRRQPLARTFAFKLMEGMRGKAGIVASQLVEERLGAGPFDFLNEISAQVPARIIADILGIPRSDLPYFQRLVELAVGTIGFFDTNRRKEFEENLVEFDAYVGKLLDDRRRNPNGDWLSEFAAATKEAGQLTEAEIRADVIALIVAGSDTTKNSIAMTLYLLLSNPAEWKKLTGDPEGMKKAAAAEGLRYDPIVLGVPRFSVKEFELDGYTITPGMLLLWSIVSSSRDPDVFANPDVFDISRTDHPKWSMGFGGGAHRCLGEALARMELEETLAAIARIAPKTEMAGPAPKMAVAPIRAVDQLKVKFG
jgi:cytochrome P450